MLNIKSSATETPNIENKAYLREHLAHAFHYLYIFI